MPLFGPPNVEKLKAKGNVKGLIKALRYEKGWKAKHVQQDAAEALGEIGDARAVEPLIATLNHWGDDVRQAAAGALVEIGTPAVESLIAALKDRASGVREGTAGVLG